MTSSTPVPVLLCQTLSALCGTAEGCASRAAPVVRIETENREQSRGVELVSTVYLRTTFLHAWRAEKPRTGPPVDHGATDERMISVVSVIMWCICICICDTIQERCSEDLSSRAPAAHGSPQCLVACTTDEDHRQEAKTQDAVYLPSASLDPPRSAHGSAHGCGMFPAARRRCQALLADPTANIIAVSARLCPGP